MAENGNGEVKQLAGVKRAYRGKVTSLEADLRAKFEADLADGKNRLKREYLEAVVDVVFADDAVPVEVSVKKAEISVDVTPRVSVSVEAKTDPTRCPNCDAPIDPMDKFCSECAYPLKEENVTDEDPRTNLLGTAGSFRRKRRRA
jgi:hypothetical protein